MELQGVTQTSRFERDASLGTAIESIPEGIVVFDRDLRLAVCNRRAAALLDLPQALLAAGTPLSSLTLFLARRGDLGEGAPDALSAARVKTLTAPDASISQRIGANGQTLEFHSAPFGDGGLVVSFADVTARVAAEAALEKMNLSLEARVAERTAALTEVNAELEKARAQADAANRDKTRFLAAASHDLLQPLNAARLYTAALVERAADTGLDELAQAIEASLSAVEEIMTALLDISRIDSGALKPYPTEFGVSDLIDKVAVEFSPLARERAVKLKLVGSRAAIVADRPLVARIVQNLVSNAVKYTRPGGRVLVGCRRRGKRLRLDVIDTGIGFNRDQHGLIFAEFSRLEHGARMAHGLGLGLSIVKRLVAALGVTMEIDSVEGKGSRFSLYLPLARTRRQVSEPPASRIEPGANLTGLRILCVDNEQPILEAMRSLLTGWGCEVRLARSLRQIDREAMLSGWWPDLVLMDYHLDQASGLDAIAWLRHNVGAQLPAALVTADRSPRIRELAEERGIAVITKPVRPAVLRATISGLATAGTDRGAVQSPENSSAN
jgi:signal transduction histidine kinase